METFAKPEYWLALAVWSVVLFAYTRVLLWWHTRHLKKGFGMTHRVTLKKAKCCECGCPILVAPYSPHPDAEYCTGMAANAWDADRQQDRFVGWICEGCAFSRVGPGLPGAISGPDLEFHY